MEFLKAKAAELTTAATAFHTTAKERMHTSIQGKKLLDKGGAKTEKAILAKQALANAAAADAANIREIEEVLYLCSRLAKTLKKIEKRAPLLKESERKSWEAITALEMPQAEQDACEMVPAFCYLTTVPVVPALPNMKGGERLPYDDSAPKLGKLANKCRICGKHMGFICGIEGFGIRQRNHEARCRDRHTLRQSLSDSSADTSTDPSADASDDSAVTDGSRASGASRTLGRPSCGKRMDSIFGFWGKQKRQQGVATLTRTDTAAEEYVNKYVNRYGPIFFFSPWMSGTVVARCPITGVPGEQRKRPNGELTRTESAVDENVNEDSAFRGHFVIGRLN